jgi:hypothetical protein
MAQNIIKLNRGDSYEFTVSAPNKENLAENYILTDSDVMYFALLHPHQRFEEAFLSRGYDHTDQIVDKHGKNTGEILIKLAPNDTVKLAPGIYYYTVKLYQGGEINENDGSYYNATEVRTIIERTKFIVNE